MSSFLNLEDKKTVNSMKLAVNAYINVAVFEFIAADWDSMIWDMCSVEGAIQLFLDFLFLKDNLKCMYM